MSTEKSRARDVADRLHSAAIHLLRRLRIQDLASGVGPAKLSALSVLVFSSRPLSLAELAEAEQVKNPTMSRLVSDMQRDGLVRIAASKEDARSIQITPTARGRELLLAGKKRRVDSLANAVESLSSVELGRLEDGVELLRQVIRRL
ncbi:MAG TPA: MarR family transcriptional regulator [Terriglobales bacterium]|nr:MarR family transcriptional regulator [Terriglobales bacterium]